MKKVLIIMAVILMLGVNAYAAGDLTVAGSVGIGAYPASYFKVIIFTDETVPLEDYTVPRNGLRVESNGVAIYADSNNRSAIVARSNGLYGIDVQQLGSGGTAGRFSSSNGTAGYFKNYSSAMPALVVLGSNVGFGTDTPDTNYKLHVVGDILADNFVQTSDIKYKKNISPIESPLAKILSLRGVSYEWKTEEYKDKGFSEGENYGVIAQEVERVLPEIVREGKESGKAVSYTQLIPVLIEAMKEQQKTIEEQQKTINELKAQQVIAKKQQKTIARMSKKLVWLERQIRLKGSVAMIDIDQP